MTRHLTLTAVEAQAFNATPVGETFWLVRANDDPRHSSNDLLRACAPCETCGGVWRRTIRDLSGVETFGIPCPDCRIELVGRCPIIGDDCGGRYSHPPLGYAYAGGQPLPIHDDDTWENGVPAIVVSTVTVYHYDGDWWDRIAPALAHYGPPESLVGQWAIALRRVPS